MSKYQSQDNPRDIAEAIEELMFNCIRRYYLLGSDSGGQLQKFGEEAEILKRRITDYLLATDTRSGIVSDGKKELNIGPPKQPADPMTEAVRNAQINERLRKKHEL